MPSRAFPLLLALALICSAFATHVRADETAERWAAAHLLAFGQLPTAAEAADATDLASVAPALAARRATLQADAVASAIVARRAWCDAFGREPTPKESATATKDAPTYFELLAAHRAALARDAVAYTAVVHRAYRTVVARDAYPEEIAYWQHYDALPFVLLVGCVEDWALRNRPGLMSTTGMPTITPNSAYLVTLRVSPAVASEVRSLLGVVASETGATPRLLAVGGAQISTLAGMNLLVVARDSLRSTGR